MYQRSYGEFEIKRDLEVLSQIYKSQIYKKLSKVFEIYFDRKEWKGIG